MPEFSHFVLTSRYNARQIETSTSRWAGHAVAIIGHVLALQSSTTTSTVKAIAPTSLSYLEFYTFIALFVEMATSGALMS